MADHFDTRYVKASRKEHQCQLCLEMIPVGSAYDRWNGVSDGYMYSWPMHKPCHLIYNVFLEALDDGDGVMPGVFLDAWTRHEMIERFKATGVWEEAQAYLVPKEERESTSA